MRRLMLAIGIAAAIGCGGVSKEQHDKTKQALQDESGKVAALESKAQSLQQQNDALQAQVRDLDKKLAATSAAKSELEVTSAKLSEQTKELQGKMNVKLSDQLLFKENSSQLTPEAKRTLDSIAEAIKQVQDKNVIVAGYTDDKEAAGQGAAAKRWQLSTARALTVGKYLAGRDIDPARIGIAGFGDSRPVAPNDSLANRALNRRAEIALTPANLQLGTVDIKPAELKTK
jgi:flagellar motor protein MotB